MTDHMFDKAHNEVQLVKIAYMKYNTPFISCKHWYHYIMLLTV